jgi:hypothetical protein
MTTRSVVVQEDPRRRVRLRVLAGLVLLGTFTAGLLLGIAGVQLQWSIAGEKNDLQARLVFLSAQVEDLQQWQANNQTRRDIDAAALEMVRLDLASQQETIAELERGIKFYKSLMAPGELQEGLSVRSIDIIAEDEPGYYQFRILVQQSARRHQLLTGSLNVSVVGEMDGKAARFDLSALSEDVPNANIRLRFKYFQSIDIVLVLPAGFTPQVVQMSAKSTAPRRSEISEEFPWSVQEKISHVGQ